MLLKTTLKKIITSFSVVLAEPFIIGHWKGRYGKGDMKKGKC